MEFANGFQEDDTPVLEARPAPQSATTTTVHQSRSFTQPPQPDTLDLTEDSPPGTPGGSNGATLGRVGGISSGSEAIGNGRGHPNGNQSGTTRGSRGRNGRIGQSPNGIGNGLVGVPTSRLTPSSSQQPSSSTSSGFAKYAPMSQSKPQANGVRQALPSSASPSTSSLSGVAAFGRVPVISSGLNARTPSAYIPYSTTSLDASNQPGTSRNHYQEQANRIASGSSPSSSSSTAPTQQPQKTNPTTYATPSSSKGKAREMVDLTNESNSDDDVIVQEPPPVCIGQIETFALIMNQAEEILPPRPVPEKAPDGKPWGLADLAKAQSEYKKDRIAYQLPLPVHIRRGEKLMDLHGRQREMLRLFTPAKIEMFGFVDQNVGTLLGPMLGDGWSGTGFRKDKENQCILHCEAEVIREGQTQPYNLRLRLLFFARPRHVPQIADALERADPPRYLGHPPVYNPAHHSNYRYANPHNTPRAGAHSADAARRFEKLRKGLTGTDGAVGALDACKNGKQVDVQRQQVEQVFHSLTSGTDLDQVTPPPVVSTKLYPHQKQALSFLLDREKEIEIPAQDPAGGKPLMVSLWQRVNDTYGRCVAWQSVVTDLQISGTRPPPQARGAILADDMGLGKTIVVISLVCTTLPDARNWAQARPSKDKHDSRLDALPTTKNGQSLPASEFTGNLYGAPRPTTTAPTQTGKQKKAQEKREKKKEEAIDDRYRLIECRSRATLIICPLSTIQNWECQFEEHTRAVEDDEGGKLYEIDADAEEDLKVVEKLGLKREGSEESMKREFSPPPPPSKADKKEKKKALSIYVYHGATRTSDPHTLADHDVVLTTFSTLGSEYSKQVKVLDKKEEDETRLKQRARLEREEQENGIQVIYGFGPNGELLEKPQEEEEKPKPKRKRKRCEGTGISPLQAVQWYRVVLDEAHIIKEHKTIQAKAACDLSTSRRICLSGTPLQNNLNDIFSLIKFIRLEPFTERAVWNQHIGTLIKTDKAGDGGESQINENLGTERLKVIMRHLTLRRTKDTKDDNGKPILSLPPIDNKLIELEFNPTESAFYASRHTRYKHEFAQLEKTDSVGKNYCTILQELLKLRQICVHPALLQESEDRSAAAGDLSSNIQQHGISKPRAVQLLALLADVGGGECGECGIVLSSIENQSSANDLDQEEDVKPKRPSKKARKNASAVASAGPSTANNSEDETPSNTCTSESPSTVVTKCQHIFCHECFKSKVCAAWPQVTGDDTAACTTCRTELVPALDAVEIGAKELQRSLEQALDQQIAEDKKQKGKKKATRLFEHSTKTRALLLDLLPFSQANPSSPNYDPDALKPLEGQEHPPMQTIGLQPITGEIVKSVVFSQWTALLDRLSDALDAEHIAHRRLDGSMNRDQRNDAMEAFKIDPKCEVLLVSLRAGGVGLNLTAGRRVYLMEPFWNPAVENQAVDRIYRLGQTMPVQTVRFIMKQSIEANMLKIQRRKMDLAQMSVGRTMSKAELAKMRREELGILLE
ncbi:uncharacterized protein JCM6883_000238 [Sporobolomyces salmoneus]|uniref:uncharacterized protein n=1 Tax=Sporobolomyces salmoneus TaxID=183962 RepID=UPI00316BDBEA